MKAEHRKELQTNALADRMGRVIQGMKRGPSKSSLLTVVLVLLVLGAIVFFFWRFRLKKERDAQDWVSYERSINVANFSTEYLERLKTLQAQSIQGRLAEIDLAWGKLQDDGINKLLVDQQAIDNVKNAKRDFEQLWPQVKDDPVLAPEARYAIAVAEETLAADEARVLGPKDNLDTARKLYEAVATEYPKSAHAKDAEKRAKLLGDREERQRIERLYNNLALRRLAQFAHRNMQQFQPPGKKTR
jgi:ribosomal protein RSM22 (predicted rRNA methylase)